MKRYCLPALLVIGLQAPAYADESMRSDVADVHRTVLANFTYRKNVREWEDFSFNHTGLEPFRGDCVTYSLAVYYQLWQRGADPYIVVLDGRRVKHMVACSDGWCADNFQRGVVRESRLKRRYGRVLLKDQFPESMVMSASR